MWECIPPVSHIEKSYIEKLFVCAALCEENCKPRPVILHGDCVGRGRWGSPAITIQCERRLHKGFCGETVSAVLRRNKLRLFTTADIHAQDERGQPKKLLRIAQHVCWIDDFHVRVCLQVSQRCSPSNRCISTRGARSRMHVHACIRTII